MLQYVFVHLYFHISFDVIKFTWRGREIFKMEQVERTRDAPTSTMTSVDSLRATENKCANVPCIHIPNASLQSRAKESRPCMEEDNARKLYTNRVIMKERKAFSTRERHASVTPANNERKAHHSILPPKYVSAAPDLDPGCFVEKQRRRGKKNKGVCADDGCTWV